MASFLLIGFLLVVGSGSDFPPPFIRNAFDTNSAAVVTNIVKSISGTGGSAVAYGTNNPNLLSLGTNVVQYIQFDVGGNWIQTLYRSSGSGTFF